MVFLLFITNPTLSYLIEVSLLGTLRERRADQRIKDLSSGGTNMNISVIIPFYNEEKQIPHTLKEVMRVMYSLKCNFELILVNDGSKDRTREVLARAARHYDNIKVLSFSRNFGKEAATCAGLDHAAGDCAILMDGDLQHPPSYIPEMVRLWAEEGFEVVDCVKEARQNESRFSRGAANLFYKIFRWLTNYDLKNASDFKLLDRKVVDAWKQLNEKATFFRGLSAWLGFRRTELKFTVADRTVGKSKWSLKTLVRLSSNAVTAFSSKPLQIVTILGLLFVCAAIILAVQTLITFITGNAASGFTTVILLNLLIGGCIMISLGLIGSYISRIYNEVKGRPRYLVSEMFTSARQTLDEPEPAEEPSATP